MSKQWGMMGKYELLTNASYPPDKEDVGEGLPQPAHLEGAFGCRRPLCKMGNNRLTPKDNRFPRFPRFEKLGN